MHQYKYLRTIYRRIKIEHGYRPALQGNDHSSDLTCSKNGPHYPMEDSPKGFVCTFPSVKLSNLWTAGLAFVIYLIKGDFHTKEYWFWIWNISKTVLACLPLILSACAGRIHRKWCAITEHPSTNLHMNRYASFFKGCRFKNTIVDGYSVIALKMGTEDCLWPINLLSLA